jgi:ketosteroid isomerase-like protein
VGGIPMNHESHEVISLRNRFRGLKAKIDVVHQDWQAAVRERDFDRQMSLMAHEGNLIRDTSAVMSAFHQLIAQELMHTHHTRVKITLTTDGTLVVQPPTLLGNVALLCKAPSGRGGKATAA